MSVALTPTWQAPRFVAGVTDQELDVFGRAVHDAGREVSAESGAVDVFRREDAAEADGEHSQEAMSRIAAVLDWPEKAVSALAERSVFEGFVTPGGQQGPVRARRHPRREPFSTLSFRSDHVGVQALVLVHHDGAG